MDSLAAWNAIQRRRDIEANRESEARSLFLNFYFPAVSLTGSNHFENMSEVCPAKSYQRQYSLGEGLWCFLRKVLSNPPEIPVLISAGELFGIGTVRWMGRAVGVAS